MPIDRNDAENLSAQIATELRKRIHAGEFATDHRFPSLRALAGEYEVAELTAHAAVRQLQAEGLLVTSQGRGTFVRRAADVAAEPVPVQLDGLRREVAELRTRLERLEQSGDMTQESIDS